MTIRAHTLKPVFFRRRAQTGLTVEQAVATFGNAGRKKRRWYQFMLDIAWPELIVIGIVATVAIGPKDMPKVMNTVGKWVGKARVVAADLHRSVEQMNFEAEAAERVSTEPQAQAATPVQPVAATAAAARDKHHHPAALHQAAPAAKDEPHDHLGST